MKRTWSAISFLIIFLLGLTSLITAKGILESLATRQVEGWLSDRSRIYTSQLTDNQKDGLVSELKSLSVEDDFTVVSRDKEQLQSGSTLYTFSVLSPSKEDEVVLEPLVLLGTTVVDDAIVEAVSTATPDSYAGYGNDAFSQVANLPSIRAGLYFRVDVLGSGEDLGDVCLFVGLSDEEFQALVDDLSSSIGVSPETLTTKMSGSASVEGLLYFFCAGAFALLFLVFCLLMVTRSLLELKTLGTHLMLGWSKGDFACELLSSQAVQVLILVPVALVGALVVLDGFDLNGAFVGYALASVLPAVVAVLVALALATLPVLTVKPVEAIHGRYSRQGFYVLAVSVYLVCIVAVFGGCLSIDQPLDMYADLSRTRFAWSEYEGWSVVQDFRFDGERFIGNPMGLSEDMYAWYAEHEHDEGVYLAKADYYQEASIQAYIGSDVTLDPFWYLAASPSYLEEIGVEVSDELIEKAEQGVRVYLIPDSLDASEEGETEEFLVASRKVYDSDIVTSFMENPEYEFVSYDASEELFTWSTESDLPTTSSGFVIAIVTAENMVPFESESLTASGLDNSYVKLDERAASSLLDEDGSASLGGSVSVRLTTVGNYIDGLKKSLEELFALFSVVLAILVATVAIMVACLVDVVNQVSVKEISVKYVLGFGTWELYRREVLFVTITALLGIGVSAAVQSTAGLIVGLALLVISNLVIGATARKKSAGAVLDAVSRE